MVCYIVLCKLYNYGRTVYVMVAMVTNYFTILIAVFLLPWQHIILLVHTDMYTNMKLLFTTDNLVHVGAESIS